MSQFPGFRLVQEKPVQEEQARLLFYRHEKTGARLLHLKNADDNKVFAIAFRTPPLGSTGNCHILEHCVLNGSDQYKTKEPFMDLLQSSLQTFLNAMTFQDRTVYPVASRNEADFQNLMDLYLDAVFFPTVRKDARIFQQEGWHYQLAQAEDELTLSGVVYNEMRGALSSPEGQVFQAIASHFYAGTLYGENAGGDPYVMPTLSYDQFIDFHRRYYHPSNAFLFLYGAIEETPTFERIGRYLDRFEARSIDFPPAMRPQKTGTEYAEVPFSLASGESEEGQAYLSMTFPIDQARTDEGRLLYELLGDLLIDSESSPLRRALLTELGAKDVLADVWKNQDIAFSIIVKGVAPERRDAFVSIVDRELRAMVEAGLEESIVQGALTSLEYDLRERAGLPTKGIRFLLLALEEGIYGVDPTPRLAYEAPLSEARKMVQEQAWTQYIQEKLVEAPYRLVMVHRPEAGRNAKRDKALHQALQEYKAERSDPELSALVQQTQALADRQNQPDSPEAKATIPTLSRSDWPTKVHTIPRQLARFGQDLYLLHPLPTAGITYLTLVFDLSHISEEEAPYATLAADLMGRLDTYSHSYQAFQTLEDLTTGGIHATPRVYEHKQGAGFQRKLFLSSKFLGLTQMKVGLDLMREQVQETRFEDLARIQECLQVILSGMEMSMVQNGSTLALHQAMAGVSAIAHYNEKLKGLSYYQWLKKLSTSLTKEAVQKIEQVYRKLTAAPMRIVNLTSVPDQLDQAQRLVMAMLTHFQPLAQTPAPVDFQAQPSRRAYSLTSDTQFVGLVARLDEKKAPYNGRFQVLANHVTNTYLYNEIRAKGGAYGQGLTLASNQLLTLHSYRDPHLLETVRTFYALPDFLDRLDLTQDELNRSIIGSLGALDQPMTEAQKARFDLANYLWGLDEDFYQQQMEEIKATRPQDLRALAAPIRSALETASIAVLGASEAIDQAGDFFEEKTAL